MWIARFTLAVVAAHARAVTDAEVAVLSAADRREPYLVAELAVMWRVAPSTVYRLIYSRRLRAERHGPRGGAIRVPPDAVAEYLASIVPEAVA
jgi:excisionase family DNA binding protein